MRPIYSSSIILVLALVVNVLAEPIETRRIRVMDPSSAVVSEARVMLYGSGGRLITVQRSAPDGTVNFEKVPEGAHVKVEAAGFRPYSAALPAIGLVEVKLELASSAETVVVSADVTPVIGEKSGAPASSLDRQTLTLLNLPELSDNLRFIPGAYVSDSGQRGGLSTMFVRGGESNYNKVVVDGVPVNQGGGSFNFGVIPSFQVDRVEMVRGAESTLYGSDAMTSVTQLWSATGSTRVPELRLGADGGTFSTANGFASIAGAIKAFDYNVFADQFQTNGQGINDDYENASQGANIGWRTGNNSSLRLRIRHSNSRTGVPGGWLYSTGTIPPNTSQYARQNDFLSSLTFNFAPTATWHNTISGFEYNHRARNQDLGIDLLRPYNDPFDSRDHFNRAGVDYVGEITPDIWSRSIFGFHFENENSFITNSYSSYGYPGSSFTHGLRRNSALYGEQIIDLHRLTLQAGLRWEHNENFGDKAVPRLAASFQILRGGHFFSGTRFRGSYAQGIKEPTFEETFGITGTYPTLPNPTLKPEQVRALEAGLVQELLDRWSLTALYFNNHFTDQIEYQYNPATFESQYINIDRALAHGAEVELHGRISGHLSIGGSYTYTATQALSSPECQLYGCSGTGEALIRRPKHLGTLLATYAGSRWGASLAGSFVGRRSDSDFLYGYITPVTSVAGYARFDVSAYREVSRYITAFATVQNILNQRYQEVAGYPAYKTNFRAGLRLRLGGE